MDWRLVVALSLILLIYLCIGAGIFQGTERKFEEETKQKIVRFYTEFIEKNPCVNHSDLESFIYQLAEDTGRFTRVAHNWTIPFWDFAGAFTFAVTVVTTIGYGHVYPATTLGRSLCVVYAVIGIPLTLIVLGGIGEQLSLIAQRVIRLKLCSDKPSVNRAFNTLIMFLSGLFLMFIVPSLVFCYVEEWSFFEALYYCFITLSTIGFGDYIAGQYSKIDDELLRNLYRILVYLWILIGLAYLSLGIKYISRLYINKAGQMQREAKKRVGSQRLSINEKKNSVRRKRHHQEDHCCQCKLPYDDSIEFNNDKSVSLMKISTVQLQV